MNQMSSAPSTTIRPKGYCALIGLCVLITFTALLYLAAYAPWKSYPSEDAAILFQYSENLANTGVISYNAGQPPSEGATDFFWMVIIAAAYRCGIPSFFAANLLSTLGLLVSALLLWRLARFPWKSGYFLFTAWLVLLPQYFAAAQGFSPYLFGMFILLCLFFFIRERAILLALSCLLTCLIRPDGIVFTIPLALFFLTKNRANWKKTLGIFILFTGIPGLVYFIWRWHYFGLMLPLPFYVKSSFERYLSVFNLEALSTNIRFSIAALPLLFCAISTILTKKEKQNAFNIISLALALFALPFLFYSCMHLEQNIAYRFQYPLLLIPAALGALSARRLKRPSAIGAGALFMILFLSPFYAIEGYRTLCMPAENIPAISKAIGHLSPKGNIATTEAGRLPYYSKWETIDLWGLNTPAFAQTVVSPDNIIRFNPDLIVLHTGGDYYGDDWRFLSATNLHVHVTRNWSNMTENAYIAAQDNEYHLLMVPHRFTPEDANLHHRLAQLRPMLKRKFGYKGAFATYYAFLINPDSPHAINLEKLLTERGAVSLEEYYRRKAAFINE